jgi:polyribonucleotide nucleotidyltransferase|tara:strand:+ start:4832 stop:5248 length:417 start_codon:yes stop_codon:yes gene_type:complete
MQFCTINEAWGNNEYITENLKNEKSDTEKNIETQSDSPIKETFKKIKKQKKNIYYNATEDSIYENFTDTINDKREREKLIGKVLKSRRCRDVLRKKFRPNLVNKLILMLDDYRDVIVLVLIGFSIIIFLNMIYNLNRN